LFKIIEDILGVQTVQSATAAARNVCYRTDPKDGDAMINRSIHYQFIVNSSNKICQYRIGPY
jgi:hypothetical protein